MKTPIEQRQQQTSAGRWVPAVAAIVIVSAGLLATSAPAAAQNGDVTFDAVFGDRSLDDVDSASPLRVDSADIIDLELTVTNDGDESVEVGQIRIESKLLSFTFLTQALRTQIVVEPGESESVTLPVDFVGVEGQASGYFRAEMRLLDGENSTLASRDFTLDIRGDAFAAANTVFYLLIVFAAVVVLRNLIAILRRRLEVNRLVRATRLGIVGLQVGVVLAIASSLFRFRAMSGAQWIPLVIIAALIGFGVGYFLTLAPKDLDEDERDDLDPERDRATVVLDGERDEPTKSMDPEALRPTIDENRATRDTVMPGMDPEADRDTVTDTGRETIGPDDPEAVRPTIDENRATRDTVMPGMDPEADRDTVTDTGRETIAADTAETTADDD
ncbi:MAG: hypothetical protein RIE08_18100 [Acidimicrobiales bacterium]